LTGFLVVFSLLAYPAAGFSFVSMADSQDNYDELSAIAPKAKAMNRLLGSFAGILRMTV